MYRKHSIKAFTLIELVIVVIIVAILVSLGMSQYNKITWRSRYAEVYNTIGMIARAKETYKAQYGNYGVYPVPDFYAGNGYGLTQVQKDLGITISSTSPWRYGIYPWTSDSDTRIYFQQSTYGSWIGYYDYVAHTWGTYDTASSPAGNYYYPPN